MKDQGYYFPRIQSGAGVSYRLQRLRQLNKRMADTRKKVVKISFFNKIDADDLKDVHGKLDWLTRISQIDYLVDAVKFRAWRKQLMREQRNALTRSH